MYKNDGSVLSETGPSFYFAIRFICIQLFCYAITCIKLFAIRFLCIRLRLLVLIEIQILFCRVTVVDLVIDIFLCGNESGFGKTFVEAGDFYLFAVFGNFLKVVAQ